MDVGLPLWLWLAILHRIRVLEWMHGCEEAQELSVPKYLAEISLVGGFNPFEKYARQMGSFPQVGGKIKNI